MNIELLPEKVERLESVFINILYLKPEDRLVSPNAAALGDLREAINQIFDQNRCIDVIYTKNTDKQFFGVRVSPNMNGEDAEVILSTDEKVKLVRYRIEFDSKLFDLGLDESELAAITIYEISSIMDNSEIFDNLRGIIDCELVTNDDVISLRDSVNYAQLTIFAIKDTLYKLGGLIFKNPEDLLANTDIQACNLGEAVVSAYDKIMSNVSGLGESLRSPKPVILQWMMLLYKDMKLNSRVIHDTLVDSKTFTASKLEIREIDACLDAINRIDMTISMQESYLDEDIHHFFDKKHFTSLNETSLFKALKKNGLRGIENDLYEYSLRVKNVDDENDAYTIMRGINNRLGILEDYIYSEQLSEHDKKHWEEVAQAYRDLRVVLMKKKLNQRTYGLFVDYSQLPSDNDKK